MVREFIEHLRPKMIPDEAAKFTVTYGLGGILTLLYLLLLITGGLLMLFYIPYPDKAYISVKKITEIVPFGRIVRNIHRISGDLMILFSFIHMLRILAQDAINNKVRERNWITGAVLFFLLFPFNFTGYLLPWDTLSYWGASIVLNLLNNIPFCGESIRVLISGSVSIDEVTLIRFYSYHVFILPVIFSFFLMNHYYLIRRAGGVHTNKKDKRVSIDILYRKEGILLFLILILLLILTTFFYDAPLYQSIYSDKFPDIIKAPWYFAAIQFMLTYINPLISGLVIPFFYLIFIIFFYKIKKLTLFIVVNIIFVLFILVELFIKT